MKQAATTSPPAAGQAHLAAGHVRAKKGYAAFLCLAAYLAEGLAAAQCPPAPFRGGLPAPAQGFAAAAEGHAWTAEGQVSRKERRAGIAARLAAIAKGFAAAAAGQARAAAGHSGRVQGHAAGHCPAPELSENHSPQGLQQKNAPRARSPDLDHSP